MCHVEAGGLVSLVQLCPDNAKGVARIRSATDDSARIILSFLNGTDEWRSIGQAAEQNNLLANAAGLYGRPFERDRRSGQAELGHCDRAGDQQEPSAIERSNRVPGPVSGGAGHRIDGHQCRNDDAHHHTPAAYRPGDYRKPGPIVNRVLTAAAALFPYTFAPRSIVSIYGESLAAATVPRERRRCPRC